MISIAWFITLPILTVLLLILLIQRCENNKLLALLDKQREELALIKRELSTLITIDEAK